jgi:hypothetical protein
MRFGNPNNCGFATNATITNNIVTGSLNLTEGQGTSGWNLSFNMGAGGTNIIIGTPIYIGGVLPAPWAGWQLTIASAGRNAGSDGLDVGSNYFGTRTAAPPVAPVNLRVR